MFIICFFYRCICFIRIKRQEQEVRYLLDFVILPDLLPDLDGRLSLNCINYSLHLHFQYLPEGHRVLRLEYLGHFSCSHHPDLSFLRHWCCLVLLFWKYLQGWYLLLPESFCKCLRRQDRLVIPQNYFSQRCQPDFQSDSTYRFSLSSFLCEFWEN